MRRKQRASNQAEKQPSTAPDRYRSGRQEYLLVLVMMMVVVMVIMVMVMLPPPPIVVMVMVMMMMVVMIFDGHYARISRIALATGGSRRV